MGEMLWRLLFPLKCFGEKYIDMARFLYLLKLGEVMWAFIIEFPLFFRMFSFFYSRKDRNKSPWWPSGVGPEWSWEAC